MFTACLLPSVISCDNPSFSVFEPMLEMYQGSNVDSSKDSMSTYQATVGFGIIQWGKHTIIT